MKIFFASQSFYPNIGGVSTYLLNLAKGLIRRGNEVIEVHLRSPKEPHEDNIQGIKVLRMPKEPLSDSLLKGYSNFKERVYKECHGEGKLFEKEPLITYGYDEYSSINYSIGNQVEELLERHPTEIVHIHDFQLLLLYRSIPRGIPIILTWHIPFIETISNHLKTFLIRHMKEFDKVVFSCEEYANAAVKAGLPKEKIEIICPIANTALFKPSEKQNGIWKKFNIPQGKKIIFCVQRIDQKSGHMQLIRAMPEVLKRCPDTMLVFAGGKSLTSKISNEREIYEEKVHKEIEKLGLSDKVAFTGTIPYEELPPYYNSADIVALASKNEGFGLAVTEGMACGKPIIGTKVPGIMLQVSDNINGFLVPVDDYQATAGRIIGLLSDEALRERMGRNSSRIVKSKFKMAISIDKHFEMYKALIKYKTDFKLEKINLQDISAIVTDFDRTITDEPGMADEKLLNEMLSLGKPLILATGRALSYARELYKKHPVWDCIIAENGCQVFFPINHLTWRFTSDSMREVKRLLKKHKFPASFGSTIISVLLESEEKLRSILSGSIAMLGFRKNADELMVLPRGIDKGTTLKLALAYLGIDPQKTIIVGDGENDIDLFKSPGYKIAVANASDRLKFFADEVTKKPSTQGVLEIIEKIKK